MFDFVFFVGVLGGGGGSGSGGMFDLVFMMNNL